MNDKKLEELSDKVWKTKGSRFIAYSRLEFHYRFSNFIMMISSATIIVINLLPFIFKELNPTFNVITTVMLSVIILTLNAFISAREYKTRAMRFHDCGRDLTRFNDYLRSLDVEYDLNALYGEYNDIIQKYDDNHKQLDYEKFMIKNSKEANCWDKIKMVFRYWIWEYRFYYAIIIILIFFVSLQFHNNY